MKSCGAPDQSVPANVDAGKEIVLTGKVTKEGRPVGGAFVRLLDSTGDFTAEVVASDAGDFRFFAAPGDWTVRALHRTGNGEATVSAAGPGFHDVAITVA
ncbi:DUF1416 domain-containing protein [Actinokineospora sp.]|uniref:DUF1416 domain-containing protein n=1 Tax=Actinokineospora sp. TaxID=1872133 RepID=UPI003D6A6F12